MLETEEVDVDYFTPASSTSLSKIFSNTAQSEDGQENSTLKYIPPLPTQVPPKPEEEKPSQCVLYVMTVCAYEWLKDSYVSKERVGFVIIKIMKSGLHNIILYDSNKTILSCLTLNSNTEIHLKENVSISFYDNLRKYWSVYTNPYEINKILDILKELNINIKYHLDTEKSMPSKDHIESIDRQQISPLVTNHAKNDNKESDTDSSVNRRTKDTILKRMATMGQSVLPPSHLIPTQTSDSSDTNEAINQHKTRHKPFKTMNKRNVEKNIVESDNNDLQVKKIAAKPLIFPEINKNSYQNTDQQILAVKTVDIITSPVGHVPEGNDMTLFLSEQRVSNSELRINMNRMTDKLDLVLEKVKGLEIDRNSSSSNPSQLQNEITLKLLNEYEKKIKTYEAFIQSKGFKCDTSELSAQSSSCNYNVNETKSSCDCKQLCEEKDIQITKLKDELQILTTKINENEQKENSLKKEINELMQNIKNQNEQIDNLNKKVEAAYNSEDVVTKVKSIMNETFQTISKKFDSDTSYSGDFIKSAVASVIKKTTIDCLKEL